MNQLIITNNAIKKIVELTNNNEKMLRISVTGGGCQGFQYNLDMDNKKKENEPYVYIKPYKRKKTIKKDEKERLKKLIHKIHKK